MSFDILPGPSGIKDYWPSRADLSEGVKRTRKEQTGNMVGQYNQPKVLACKMIRGAGWISGGEVGDVTRLANTLAQPFSFPLGAIPGFPLDDRLWKCCSLGPCFPSQGVKSCCSGTLNLHCFKLVRAPGFRFKLKLKGVF